MCILKQYIEVTLDEVQCKCPISEPFGAFMNYAIMKLEQFLLVTKS
jgi:hypothetical protein